MPLRLKAELKSLLNLNVHHFATLWRIERTDGTVLRFTDHDWPVTYAIAGTDESYTPAGTFDATAREKQAGIRDHNLEAKGILSSDAITDEDLRAGLYQEAKVTELLVDWKTPFAGAFQTNIYYISGITYSNEMWHAQLSGQPVWMRKDIGTVLNNTCRHDLGYGICGLGVHLDDIKHGPATITSVQEYRRVFTASALTGAAGLFSYGQFEWITGANAGLTNEVLEHEAGGKISFALQSAYDVAVGDTFYVWEGCDRKLDTCIKKFNNAVNFGGFPGIIGTDKLTGPPAQNL